jgi:ABC-2 type transport system ATP-binding protein
VNTALVPQDYAFYAALTGRDNLRCFGGLHGLQGANLRQRIAEVSRVCALDDKLDRLAASYSGGVKRRLNLAIGLLNRPSILYLDEPTVGIDAQSRSFILDSIRRLRYAGVTVVYTSHYMEEIQALCDDVAVIDHGEVRLRGPLEDLLSAGGAGTALLTLSTEPGPAAIAVMSRLGAVHVDGRRVRIALAGSGGSLAQLLADLRHEGLETEQCEFGKSRLEDVYLAMTQGRLRD